MKPKRLLLLMTLMLFNCQKVGKLGAGKYDVYDQEYSSQNYLLERKFTDQGAFEESHTIDHCLLMDMRGKWKQDGNTLTLKYTQMRNRPTCHDSLPTWDQDSAELKIPIRNVDASTYESMLAASDGKPAKWIKWNRVD